MSALTEIQRAVAHVLAEVAPGVVAVGRGAGFVSARGQVVTNAHNLTEREPEVRFSDGQRTTGTVAGVDVDADLAVVAVDTGDRAPVTWAGESAAVGTCVLAVAGARHGTPSVTVGFVSATGRQFRGPRGRRITDALEHSAPAPRGASGGPVLNLDGAVVGINTHRRGDGFYLAQPASPALRDRLAALERGEVPRRPYLGVVIAPTPVARRLRSAVGLAPRDGVLVREVEPGGLAADAGLQRGDLIVAADGAPVTDPDGLHAALDAAGDRLVLQVVRGVEELTLTVALTAST